MNQNALRAKIASGMLEQVSTSVFHKEQFSSRPQSHSVSDDEVSPEASGAPKRSKRQRRSWQEKFPVIFDNIMARADGNVEDVNDDDILACLSLLESVDSDMSSSKKRRKNGQVFVSDQVFGANIALIDDEECSCGSFLLGDDSSLHLFGVEDYQQQQSSLHSSATSGPARHREAISSDTAYDMDLYVPIGADPKRFDNGDEDDISINADVLSELVAGGDFLCKPTTNGLARRREANSSNRGYTSIDLSFPNGTDSKRFDKDDEGDISINTDVLNELVAGDLCEPTSKVSTEVAKNITNCPNATSKITAEPLTSKTALSEKTFDPILGIELLPTEDKKEETVRTSSSRTTHYEHSLIFTTLEERSSGAAGSQSELLHPNYTDSTEKKITSFLTLSRTNPSENTISREDRYHAQAIVKTTTANQIVVHDRKKDKSIGSESVQISTNSFKSINSSKGQSSTSPRSKTTSRKTCANINHQLVVSNEYNTTEPFFSAILPKVSQTTPPGSLNESNVVLTPFDVLLGRGKRCNINPGNERFRLLVDEKKALYFQQPTKKKKNEVSIHVMECVYAYGGRFLEVTCNDPLTYQVVSDHRARKKCSQRLRDG